MRNKLNLFEQKKAWVYQPAARCVSAFLLLFVVSVGSGCPKSDNGKAAAGGVTGNGSANKAGSGATSPKQPLLDVVLRDVTVQDASRFIEVTGTLYGEEEVTLAAEVEGRVVEILADLGDQVPHGGTLARIDTTEYELAVDESKSSLLAALARLGLEELPAGEVDLEQLPVVARATAQEVNAKARLERARKLFERPAPLPPLISEQDYADILTQYEVAKSEVASERLNAKSLLADARVRASSLRQAEQRLKDTTVIAPSEKPLTYRVAARQVSIGEMVSVRQAMFRLVASNRIKFRGQVPERFAGSVKVGARALVSVDGFDQPFEAAVTRVSPAVDIPTRSFGIEVEADNSAGMLKPGSFATSKVLNKVDSGVQFVSANAVVQFAGVQRVFSVKNGVVQEHRVKLGDTSGEMVEVIGLPNDVTEVVDQPARGIGAGATVRVKSDRE